MKKMIRSLRRAAAALLAALCLLPAVSVRAASDYYPDMTHSDVDYAHMPRTGIELDRVDDLLCRFADDPAGQYDALLELVDEIVTQEYLFEIESSRFGSDEALSDELEQVQQDYTLALDRIYLAISDALAGPQGEALRALMPEGEADSFTDYDAATDAELESTARENELIQDYYLLPQDESFPDAAAEIYLQLVALRREEAHRAGYDSYADYAYDSLYARDYTPRQIQHLTQTVKERIVPLYLQLERSALRYRAKWGTGVPADTEILDAIEEHLPHISPELSEAMDYLRTHGLYCIGNGDEMLDMGYTVSLPAYRSAFLFNKVSSPLDAYQSTVHEFGHFNAAYHDPTPSLYVYSALDVSEVQSQALELLFLPCLQDILAGDDEDQRTLVELRVLSGILTSVVDGFLYNEFEQTVYESEDMTVAELHALEARLNHEYGLDEFYGTDVFWPYISHLFEQPFYYISYAASALPALDIWQIGLTDRDAAVDAYLRISAAGTEEWFLDVLEDCGLHDVTEKRTITRIADGIEAHLGDTISAAPHTAGHSAVCFAAIAVFLLAAILLWRSRRRALK